MKQTKLSQNGNSLLAYAISRLSPEVFSHAMWARFGKKDKSASLNVFNDLLSPANNLQDVDPSSACQVLLICAVYQNYASQHYNALRITQQALPVAKHTSLTIEMIWAIWGTSAIYVQQAKYEQAAGHSMLVLQDGSNNAHHSHAELCSAPLKPYFSQGFVRISVLNWPELSTYSYFGRFVPINGE